MKELITARLNVFVLYTLFWQHVSTQDGCFQASNVRFIKVLYTVVLEISTYCFVIFVMIIIKVIKI